MPAFFTMKQSNDTMMTDAEVKHLNKAKYCYMCNQFFTNNIVKRRDHENQIHVCWGATHHKCATSYFNNNFLPLVRPSLTGYELHLNNKHER